MFTGDVKDLGPVGQTAHIDQHSGVADEWRLGQA
jgi:hypothetical protein